MNPCQPSPFATRCTVRRPWLVQPWPAGYCRTYRSVESAEDCEVYTCCSRGVADAKAVAS